MRGCDCLHRENMAGVEDANSFLDALGRNAQGVIQSYGKAQSGAYTDVIQTGALSTGAIVALIIGGVLAYKYLLK